MEMRSRRLVLLATALCLLPLLLQLPGSLGIGFGVSALAVMALSWRQPMPSLLRIVLGIGGILAVFAVAPGIGRDTACAVLAAMLALKPAETFSLRDGRSLVGFALFAPFATFLLDQGPLSLVLALAAVVLALLALQQLARDQAGVQPPTGARWWSSSTGVLRLLALGLPLALAAFWLFPRLPSPMWGLPDRVVARPGLSDNMTPGGFLDLMNDDSPAARVQFFGATPRPEQMYWRGPVLWDFDGRSWHQIKGLQRFPAADLRPSATRWDYQIDLEATDRDQLIALDLPTQVPDGAAISIDFSVYAPNPLNNVSRWRMQSTVPVSAEPDLWPVLRQRALALPQGFNPRTVALGRQWRQEAGSDDQGRSDTAIVNRAMAWISRDFAYTLSVPLAGRHEVDDFLFQRKQGYCEHFSSSFVVLMRAAGIPARVVTGYAGGYRNPIGDYWLVLHSSAHAWAEIWLPGRGWVRVDPTAAVAPERVYDTLADREPGRIGNFTGLVPMFNASDWMRRGWNDFVLGYDAQRQQRLLNPFGMDNLGTRGLILIFGFIAGLALAWMAWLIARGERERDPLLRAWRRLGARYVRIGQGRLSHEPAQAWAERAGADVPTAGQDLRSLSQRFSNARYAGPGKSGASEQLRALVRDIQAHRP
ncbi:MAG: transglutaminase TgpA family protein [Thermomonas sp.]